jgi:outer membrane protein assembly factor BamB
MKSSVACLLVIAATTALVAAAVALAAAPAAPTVPAATAPTATSAKTPPATAPATAPAATPTASAAATDWPQLQAGPARLGRTPDSVAPPYRARWIWCGPQRTIRNKDSEAAWKDDLEPREGNTYAIPIRANLTIAESVQPVLAAGRLFVGTMEGKAYAIAADDGKTIWTADIPGGTVATAAVAGEVVVFAGTTGTVTAIKTADGMGGWTFTAKKAITGAPCVLADNVFIADHGGNVVCLNAATGKPRWQVRLPAPVLGTPSAAGDTVYVPAEDMNIYALNIADGGRRAAGRVRGQSFRFQHPVIFNNLVWIQSATVPVIGSEYVMETLMADSADLKAEEANIARWLQGDTAAGRWTDASKDWQHLFALTTKDLTPPFTVLCGPVEGCGMSAEPVVIDNQDRVLAWWKTRFPKLTNLGAFGTKFSIDLAAADPATGRRIPIDNGHLSGMWPGPESDNLYALTVAGDYVWLRQTFRGTQVINLKTSDHRFVAAEVRHRDASTFNADIVYANESKDLPRTPQPPTAGRTSPIVVGNCAYVAETFAVTCIEHKP